MKKLIRTFKQLSILFLAITFFGCEDDDAVLPKVHADFTYEINTDTGTVTFINTSEQATTYSWDLGDDSSSTLINPVNVYVSGTYTIILTASNVAGSSDTIEYTITIDIPLPVTLPITFDDDNVKYEAVAFEGAAFDIVDNPAPGGSNDKASKVGAITNSGKINEGIYFDLGTDIDFAINKAITMNFWADAPLNVLLKLEKGVSSLELIASHGGTGWETLSFDFNSLNKYSRVTLYVDKVGTTAGTFYLDDIEQTKSAPVITLNGNATINVVVGGTFTDPGATAIDGFGKDISSSIVVAGDAVDVNTLGTYIITYNVSDNEGEVAKQVTRTVIVSVDAIAPIITLIGSSTVNLTVGGTFTDAGATAADNVDGNITSSIVVGGDTVDVNTADTYIITYNVSDAAGNAAAQVIRTIIVAIAGTGSGNSGLATNGDFETGDTSGWTTFVDAAGASFTASNAEAACGNFSGHLISDFEAGNGGAVDAVVKQANIGIGTVTPNIQVTVSFDIRGSVSDGGVFFAEFFSELSGGGVSKAEIFGGGPLNVTDTWTHYSFTTTTGSDVSGGITLQMKTSCGPVADCLVDVYFDNVFVDLGTTGGDDCSGGGGTGGGGGGTGDELATNGDFETGDTSGWATFVDAAGASFTASNSDPSEGTFSGNLIADVDAGTGGAVDAVVKQANVGAGGTVTPNTEYVISFDLRGSAGDGGVFFAEFFSELSGGGVSKAEIITGGPHPLSSTWTNYSYTVLTGPDVSGGITLQMKSSCGPVAGCLVDVSFDNVSIKLK